METQLSLHDASVVRMGTLKLGDPVTNVCAGEKNPMLHCFFVAYKVKAHKNKYGAVHRSHWAKCTDKKGHFWNIGIEVIHRGHLNNGDRERLFQPVWDSRYGQNTTQATPAG